MLYARRCNQRVSSVRRICSAVWQRPVFLGNAGKVTNTLRAVGISTSSSVLSRASLSTFDAQLAQRLTSAATSVVPGVNPYAGGRTQTQWLNPAAFAQPPAATAIGQTNFAPLGGAPIRCAVRGSTIWTRQSSNFPISKKTNLEFRLETFNTLNHPQFGQPGQLNFQTSGFSKITSLRATPNSARVGQLALKLYI